MKKHITFKKAHDTNGNSVLRIRSKSFGKSFTIQTNGNLPTAHRNDITQLTQIEYDLFISEIAEYMRKFGSSRQRTIFYNVCMEIGKLEFYKK